MYNLGYDFGQYNNVIAAYMKVLTDNSATNFIQQLRGEQIINQKQELEALNKCIQNLKEYLYYVYQEMPEAFNHTINALINNVKTIAVLPSGQRGVYGYTEIKSKKIHINPNMGSHGHLTGEERMRLYVAHELGHVINRDWLNKAMEYANQQIRQGRLKQEQAQLFLDGFSMLDEATAQNRAENFTYRFSRKQRTGLLNCRNPKLFNGETYKSNFDYYGELQEPSIMFARTLRGIGKENNDTKALDMLSERAMFSNFFDNILNEYSRDGQMPNFIKEAQYMGLLKRAAYANFGRGELKYLRDSKGFLVELKDLTSRMRDYREPFDDSAR